MSVVVNMTHEEAVEEKQILTFILSFGFGSNWQRKFNNKVYDGDSTIMYSPHLQI